jgi:hypothetical protein
MFIPADPEAQIELIELNGDFQQIQELIGGSLGAVRNENTVGYVHDEGLLIGLPFNELASVMYGQGLVGDVVVVGSLDKEGYYDGDNHDLPAEYLAFVAVINETGLVL